MFYIPENYFKIKSINSIYTRNYGKDFYFKGESHNFWEMVYVEKGTLTIAEDENIYELSSGQAIFHAPMEFHRFWAKKTQPATVFKIISFDLETNIEHNLSKGVFSVTGRLSEMFEDLYIQIESSFEHSVFVEKKENNSSVDEMLAFKILETFLLSVISESSPEYIRDVSLPAQRYTCVINFMNDNICENLLLDDIAEGTHLSTSYIKKIFKIYAGYGVMHYFTRLKIIHSLKLIAKGMSIKDISEKLSFSSPNYYTAVFKREMGILPTKYRQAGKIQQ